MAKKKPLNPPGLFSTIIEMQDDLLAAKALAIALAMLADSMEEGEGQMVQQLARTIRDHVKAAEGRRVKLCGLLFRAGVTPKAA
jgi:hypothetical protein